jgi:hypothetical protein
MKTLTIEFEEFPSETVEVRISPVPVVDFFKVQTAGRSLRVAEESFTDLATVFAPFVEAWSFPEPVGVEGLLARDYNWFIAVVNLWIKGVRDVPLPLPLTSSDGELSADQTTSPESSAEPSSSTAS